MCRMMGVLSGGGIKAEWILPFENLAVYGKIRKDMKEPGHHDGWGMVAYFKEGSPEYLEREPHSVTKDSEHFKNSASLIEESNAMVALIHFRKISVGAPQISNTHPFVQGKWVFAHNGTIFEHENIPLTHLKPAGTTDSERFFLHLIEQISHLSEIQLQAEQIKKTAEEICKNFKHTSLTFLLTDGKTLFAYRECDPQYDDYYTLYFSNLKNGTIFCSEPLLLPQTNWKPLENNSLIFARI